MGPGFESQRAHHLTSLPCRTAQQLSKRGSGLIVNWVRGGAGVVVATVFVFVRCFCRGGNGETDCAERGGACGNRQLTGSCFGCSRKASLVPYMQHVASRRNAPEGHIAGAVRQGVIGCGYRDYDRAHFRMNVTKDIADARLIELDET